MDNKLVAMIWKEDRILNHSEENMVKVHNWITTPNIHSTCECRILPLQSFQISSANAYCSKASIINSGNNQSLIVTILPGCFLQACILKLLTSSDHGGIVLVNTSMNLSVLKLIQSTLPISRLPGGCRTQTGVGWLIQQTCEYERGPNWIIAHDILSPFG